MLFTDSFIYAKSAMMVPMFLYFCYIYFLLIFFIICLYLFKINYIKSA